MIVYRTMNSGDIPAGLALCRAAGWNQVAGDWEMILNLSPGGCRVATINNRVVGTVTTICYQHSFCWIGMVLVDPAYQGQKIGSNLFKEALQILQKEETVKLDATPSGREMYKKYNFIDEHNLSRMVASPYTARALASSAVPIQENDLSTLIEFDLKIFGAERSKLLHWLLEAAPEYAFMIMGEHGIEGYCMGRRGHNFDHIGPVIARGTENARNLLSAALNNCMGKSVIVDVFLDDKEWVDWLTSIGFKHQRSLTRMYCGSNKSPGMSEHQFAILGPEFG